MLDGIVNRDARRVARALRGLPEAERRALAPELLRHARGIAGTGGESVVHVALAGTATLTEIRRLGIWSASTIDVEQGLAVLLDRRPDWLQEYAEWRLTGDALDSPWTLVRGLVRAGAIERPGPPYLSALIRASRPRYHGGEAAAELVAADPTLLEREVWDLLTSDTGEESLRAADVTNDWAPGAGWNEVIRARLPRERVLNAVLDGLANDMVAYRAAWHTKLWKDLAPTPAELAARADRLRVLLGAAAEAIVAFAVEQLTRAKVPVPADDLAPALAAASKKTVRGALKLLGDEPAAATIALGHADAAVQGAALDRLERTTLDDGARDGLLRHLDLLSATMRPRAEALLGLALPATEEVVAVDVSELPEAIRTALNFGGPLPPAPIAGEPVLGEPVPPLETVEALAQSLAERHEYGPPFPEDERQLDAILRHCATREPFEGALAPFVESLRELSVDGWLLWPRGVAASWLTGTEPKWRDGPSSVDFLRLHTVGTRAARGEAGPLLALPTHVGGWIDARVLVQRVVASGTRVDEVELAQAILRLALDHRAEALAAAADLPGASGAALRCAFGGEPVEAGSWVADAARAVAGLTPIVAKVVHHQTFKGDALRVRVPTGPVGGGPLGAALGGIGGDGWYDSHDFPARTDLAAAAAIRRISRYLDSTESVPTAGALLPRLLPPRQPIAPLTVRFLVLALGSGAPGEHLLAVDVLIAAIEDGRVDALPPDDVGLIKPNRLAARLTTIAEAGPLHGAVVRELLDASIHLVPARSGPLLVLFDELCAQTSTGPRRSREHLRTSKHKAAKALLNRHGDPPAEEAQLALAARARRARRWMAAT
ncbi:DUF6493 family protein [Solirubrobacter phytolaccae]|uniref:DUF6493 family protein n=1 Tax=Solirubrobacter phytolaccae TaxID=1404360 RepID=A0A9X3ND92_9ACTN|nr:DUF6493 family protein [Solirubrobacter phytolaccae]MDA0183054.1 DUF6493 family protein [Solirubrobacter phytolaccae]